MLVDRCESRLFIDRGFSVSQVMQNHYIQSNFVQKLLARKGREKKLRCGKNIPIWNETENLFGKWHIGEEGKKNNDSGNKHEQSECRQRQRTSVTTKCDYIEWIAKTEWHIGTRRWKWTAHFFAEDCCRARGCIDISTEIDALTYTYTIHIHMRKQWVRWKCLANHWMNEKSVE